MKSIYNITLSTALCLTTFAAEEVKESAKPNIIFIFADDMGIGDVSHNGGKALTPALDQMAQQGMRFTDAHTTSSVCTPSRYGLLTGRYAWRTHLQTFVYNIPTSEPLIDKDLPTVASLLKNEGYNTACIGKWHMGFKWQLHENYTKKKDHKGKGWEIDYSKSAITPTSNGFDYYFGILASLDMPPYLFVENDKAIALPTVSKGFKRQGPATKDFIPQLCLPKFAEKSVEYIDKVAKEEKPFFLYVPLTSPHTPITPNEQWLGKSEIGTYGDFVMETDWVVGQILEAVKRNGISENTLVLFSTDNGCSPAAQIPTLEAKGHYPNGNLRGHKADIYEGGHRVPTIAVWPKVIKAGSTSNRLTTLADFYATCADITNAKENPKAGVDSISFLPALKGEKSERTPIIMHSIQGAFAIRKGDWKLCLCSGSGGWSLPKIAKKGSQKRQLFNLKEDLTEQNNVIEKHPEIEKELYDLLVYYVENGRSTPGPLMNNDVEIQIEKESL